MVIKIKNILATRIRALRIESNKTQREIANIIGLTPKMISFYELGERVPPNDVLAKLADIFGVSTDYLLGRTDELGINKKPINDELLKLDSLSPEDKKAVLSLINHLLEKQSNQ